MTTPVPSAELVSDACKAFDKENGIDERALTELFRLYPNNVDHAHVLLKVVAVNSLYSTNIFAFRLLAKQIVNIGQELDELIKQGSLAAFDLLEYLKFEDGHKRSCFSFASKYLSWHDHRYPIYDSYVDLYVTTLNRQEELGLSSSSSWTYATFKGVVDELLSRYALEGFTYKQLDAFFVSEGYKLQAKKPGVPPSQS